MGELQLLNGPVLVVASECMFQVVLLIVNYECEASIFITLTIQYQQCRKGLEKWDCQNCRILFTLGIVIPQFQVAFSNPFPHCWYCIVPLFSARRCTGRRLKTLTLQLSPTASGETCLRAFFGTSILLTMRAQIILCPQLLCPPPAIVRHH